LAASAATGAASASLFGRGDDQRLNSLGSERVEQLRLHADVGFRDRRLDDDFCASSPGSFGGAFFHGAPEIAFGFEQKSDFGFSAQDNSGREHKSD